MAMTATERSRRRRMENPLQDAILRQLIRLGDPEAYEKSLRSARTGRPRGRPPKGVGPYEDARSKANRQKRKNMTAKDRMIRANYQQLYRLMERQ